MVKTTEATVGKTTIAAGDKGSQLVVEKTTIADAKTTIILQYLSSPILVSSQVAFQDESTILADAMNVRIAVSRATQVTTATQV
jgi:hypothetical protein